MDFAAQTNPRVTLRLLAKDSYKLSHFDMGGTCHSYRILLPSIWTNIYLHGYTGIIIIEGYVLDINLGDVRDTNLWTFGQARDTNL